MEFDEDENLFAAMMTQRAPNGKKRLKLKTSKEPKQAWMKNSFLNADKNSTAGKAKATEASDAVDSLNTSDSFMAEIDIDLLTDPNHISSPSQKRLCSTTKISGDGKRSTRNSVHNASETECGSNNHKDSFFHGEDDLFGADDFDDIFFLKGANSGQLDDLDKFVMEECAKDICDSNNGQSSKICPEVYVNTVSKNDDVFHSRADKEISKSKTPTSWKANTRKSDTLKERLKQRLLNNVGVASPSAQGIESRLKAEAVSKARIDASQIRKDGTEVDIGPFYGLPSKVQELYETVKGIKKLYDWQDECLKLTAVKEKKNLIYTLPTSGGKTLVAEVLILRELLCYQRDALLILPFISIVQEKVQSLSEFASELGFLVEEYAGSRGRFPPVKRKQKKSLYVATIEKGHSLINSLIETSRLDGLGLVVVDELHMLGEGGSRGACLESTLLKILHSKAETQIVGMSATLNNISDIQKFLNADLYSNDFRPVQLQEYVKIEENLFCVNTKALSKDDMLEHSRILMFPYSSEIRKRDPDQLLGLVSEVIPDNSCLVFCSTKKNCENVALMLSELMCKHQRHLTNVHKNERKQLLKELHRCGNSKICPTLSYTVHFGIAYHHSGLTMDERKLIEEAYSQGTLCLLTCTSTLAAGVNLPAKRVILRSPYVAMEFIKYSQYKQMAGRAGRAGLDSSGESILIAKKQDRFLVKDLLSGPKDVCHSSLMYEDGQGIRSLLLSAIGLKIITTTDAAFQFLGSSLLSIQSDTLKVVIQDVCRDALQFLIDQQLVMQGYRRTDNNKQELCLEVSMLGNATFKGSVSHVYSKLLHKDLQKSEESLMLSNHFHLLYLVTPYDMATVVVPAWDVFYNRYCQLPEAEIRVANLIGISENYLNRKSIGLSCRQKVDTLAMNRFYLALILWDLWNQLSIWDVAERYSQSRGFVQNLLTGASSFASCVFHFCKELEEFWAYQDLLGNVVKRLSFCVTSELIPLMEVPGILAARAKQLYSAGICSLADLAASNPDDLSGKIEHLSRKNARQIISSAKNLVEEKTAVLMEEVESLVTVTTAP